MPEQCRTPRDVAPRRSAPPQIESASPLLLPGVEGVASNESAYLVAGECPSSMVATIAGVLEHLAAAFPDGIVRVQRRAVAGIGTLQEMAPGTWQRVPQASSFRLLEVSSAIGAPSPAATRQWTATRHGVRALLERGLIA